MQPRLVLSVAALLAGVFLIGASLTGLATSQTCCVGEFCDADAVCSQPVAPEPALPTSVVGLFALVGGFVVLRFRH